MNDHSVINRKAINDIRELSDRGNGNLLGKIIGIFVTRSEELEGQISDSVRESDLEQLWMSAHALKSSCGNVGAERVFEICASLETKGRTGDIAGSEQLLESLRLELLQAREELSTYLQDNQN